MKNELPEIFDTFGEARRNGFLKMKELKDDGKKVVGIFCTYTPREIIFAAKAYPVSLCSTSDETIPEAEKRLPKNLCPLIKSSYGFAVTDKCPYMYFSDLVVGETTCDGKKKMYELLGEIKDVHVMQLPQNTQSNSLALWKDEIHKLVQSLEEKFQVTITEDDIRDAIKLCNEERDVVSQLYELGKLSPPPLSGTEMHAILNGTVFMFDKAEQNRNLLKMIDELKERADKQLSPIDPKAKRILLTGCPSGGLVEKLIKPIEAAGAVVVCLDNCVGIKSFHNKVDESKDPFDAIAERYLKIPCSVMSPNEARFEMTQALAKEYQVDGVIDAILQACHTYSIETDKMRSAMEQINVPYMAIETDYSSGDSGQVKTRIEAFIETL